MTEEKAESLYGPAPEGDEDPHANQEPSDPGERSGPFPFEAKYLSGAHLGFHLRLTDTLEGGQKHVVEGMLTSVQHGASLISDITLGRTEPDIILGRRWVQVSFPFGGARLSCDAVVELLD